MLYLPLTPDEAEDLKQIFVTRHGDLSAELSRRQSEHDFLVGHERENNDKYMHFIAADIKQAAHYIDLLTSTLKTPVVSEEERAAELATAYIKQPENPETEGYTVEQAEFDAFVAGWQARTADITSQIRRN